MNFFGHACVAGWRSGDARFVLGAMLPDFASMARVRLAELTDAEMRAGARLHHRTDAVFHECAAFRALYLDGAGVLRERGLRRGPARGAAHVGIELLLDGVLVEDAATAQPYLDALEHAEQPEVDASIRWRDGLGRARWRDIRTRLRGAGAPHAYRDADAVADRVTRALSSRPRLELVADEQRALRDWLRAMQPAVRAAAPGLIEELRHELVG